MKRYFKLFIAGNLIFFVCDFLFISKAFAYLDPGTGSYIFQLIIALFIGAAFSIKLYWEKIKIYLTRLFSKKRASKNDYSKTS